MSLFACLSGSSFAQSNADDEVDVFVAEVGSPSQLGREGSYPTGRVGLSFLTTICNQGQKRLDWYGPMDDRHPFICFVIARESDGRMVQISDRSYVKHGIVAANSTLCGSCSEPFGNLLGLGCSDTYSTGLNGDRYTLGPPSEIDPWLGVWDRQCSLFDRGFPAVGGAAACDENRSLTGFMADNNFGPVGNRIEINDVELDVSGADYYAMTYYVVETEADKVRDDNMGVQKFNVSRFGNNWNFSNTGPLELGTVLEQWSGATVTSNSNGKDDGRVYVAVKVTEPTPGTYHYEYAFHNRDNGRGIGEISIPVCPEATISNLGFKDVDEDGTNDWSAVVAKGALNVSQNNGNALEWNTIYNVWFDSDAAPEPASLDLVEFRAGAGAPDFAVTAVAPTGIFSRRLPSTCGGAPDLTANGRATLGNAGFELTTTGNTPGARNVLLVGFGPATSYGRIGCTLWSGASARSISVARSDGAGTAVHALPIPNQVSLEGIDLVLQCAEAQTVAGPRNSRSVTLSDGLLIRLGNSSAGCP